MQHNCIYYTESNGDKKNLTDLLGVRFWTKLANLYYVSRLQKAANNKKKIIEGNVTIKTQLVKSCSLMLLANAVNYTAYHLTNTLLHQPQRNYCGTATAIDWAHT